MKIGIFIQNYDNIPLERISGVKFANKLKDYNSQLDIEIYDYHDILISIKTGQIEITDITGKTMPDIYYLRGISNAPIRHAIANYCRLNGFIVVNTESNVFQSMTKLEQLTSLAIERVPIIDTLYVSKKNKIKEAIKLNSLNFPLVAKSIYGKNGNDNILIDDIASVDNIDFDDIILQPYIPNAFDYRLIVASNKVLLCYKRIRNPNNTNNYKNNISQGGIREFVQPDSIISDIAIRAAKAINREFAGVDIITNETTGENVVLEINFNFGTPSFDDTKQENEFYKSVANYFLHLSKKI